MIGCTSGGRGGGGSGSRNPGFAASTTPISESVEMMTKQSWNDADDSPTTTKLSVDLRRNDIENNGGGTRIDDCEETRVRVHDDDENNGTIYPQHIKLKKTPRHSSHPELDVPGIDESRKYLCGLSNFQVTFILGMMGFILFWLGLLLRIYLPDEFFS